MTAREIVETLGKSIRMIQKCVKKLFPEYIQKGETAHFNKTEVTTIKYNLAKNYEVTHQPKIKLEAEMLIQQALTLQQEKIKYLQVENSVMKPKADYYDALVADEHLTNFRDTAKELGITEKSL